MDGRGRLDVRGRLENFPSLLGRLTPLTSNTGRAPIKKSPNLAQTLVSYLELNLPGYAFLKPLQMAATV